jgi:hypothetical protein
MLNPAQLVIEKFGGLSATARAVGNGTTRQIVKGWEKRGVIPTKRQPQVLEAAQRESIELSPADLIGGSL